MFYQPVRTLMDPRKLILVPGSMTVREAAKLAQQRYEAGVTDLITVLDAQRTLLGIEATRAIRRLKRHERLPIIAMTDIGVPVSSNAQNTPVIEKRIEVIMAVGNNKDSNSAAITM